MDITEVVLAAYCVPFATWIFTILVRAGTAIFGEEKK
jgi:hypothetical protein